MCKHHDNPIDNRAHRRPTWESADGTKCFITIYHAAVAEAVFRVLDEERKQLS